jgi:hypothetical protein
MKLFFRLVVFMAFFSTSAFARMAERMPDQPGSIDSYFSDNGKYAVTITYGEHLPSWSFKENGRVLWSEPLLNEPGAAAISDNGEAITLPLWGWRDEGGSSGVAVYNKEGKLVKEILFKGGSSGEEALRWVHDTRLSPDGKYFIIGENGKEHANVTLFNAETGEIVWKTEAGLPEMVEVKVANGGKFALAATHENKGSAMEFLLFDHSGATVWQKKIVNNFSYEVKHYMKFNDNGSGFEIYDLKKGRYISILFPRQGNQQGMTPFKASHHRKSPESAP